MLIAELLSGRTQDPIAGWSWRAVCKWITQLIHRIYGGNNKRSTRSSHGLIRQHHGRRYQTQQSTHQQSIEKFTSDWHLFQRFDDAVQYANDGKTNLRRIKYYRRHFTLSTPPACIGRYARNGARKPTKTKRGQISSGNLPLSIMRYENNSAYQETPDTTMQISHTRQRIWRRH